MPVGGSASGAAEERQAGQSQGEGRRHEGPAEGSRADPDRLDVGGGLRRHPEGADGVAPVGAVDDHGHRRVAGVEDHVGHQGQAVGPGLSGQPGRADRQLDVGHRARVGTAGAGHPQLEGVDPGQTGDGPDLDQQVVGGHRRGHRRSGPGSADEEAGVDGRGGGGHSRPQQHHTGQRSQFEGRPTEVTAPSHRHTQPSGQPGQSQLGREAQSVGRRQQGRQRHHQAAGQQQPRHHRDPGAQQGHPTQRRQRLTAGRPVSAHEQRHSDDADPEAEPDQVGRFGRHREHFERSGQGAVTAPAGDPGQAGYAGPAQGRPSGQQVRNCRPVAGRG